MHEQSMSNRIHAADAARGLIRATYPATINAKMSQPMNDINTEFCRELLRLAHKNIRRAFPDVNLRTAISGVGPHAKQYFIQIDVPGYPAFDNYYAVDNMTHAKATAWNAFFEKYAPEKIKREIDREGATDDNNSQD